MGLFDRQESASIAPVTTSPPDPGTETSPDSNGAATPPPAEGSDSTDAGTPAGEIGPYSDNSTSTITTTTSGSSSISTSSSSNNGNHADRTSMPATTGSGGSYATESSGSAAANMSASSSRNGWQSPGAVAGIAVASAIIGAVLAALVVVYLFRRRHRNTSRERAAGNGRRQTDLEPSEKAQELIKSDTARGQGSTRAQDLGLAANGSISSVIDALLPQQEDDASIRQCCLLVFDQIELHVYNFYSDKSLRAELGFEQQAELSWFSTSTLPSKVPALPQLLQHSSQKTKIIQHCLAYYAVRLVSTPTSSSSETIYPQHLASVLSIADNSLSPSVQSDGTESEASRMLAKARWRQLTAYLKPELFKADQQYAKPSRTTTGAGDANRGQSAAQSNERVQAAAKRFTSAFAPFAAQDDAENFSLHVDHLAEVLHSTLQMALWLFKEPATFRFDWKNSSSADVKATVAAQRGGGLNNAKGRSKRRGSTSTSAATGSRGEEPFIDLTMMPGLRKTHDANGARIAEGGLPIVAPVTERVSWRR